MTPADFFAAVTPLYEGRADLEATARALWGSADGSDARRLAIHARDCARSRRVALTGVYRHTLDVLVNRSGAEACRTLTDAYFAAHPPRSFDPNANGAALSSFLEARAEPPWLPQLADLEWWDWHTFSAPDAAEPAAQGLAPTLELRAYRWDVLGWMLDGADPRRDPEQRRAVVAFWRDRHLDARCEELGAPQIAVLRAVRDRAPIGAELEPVRAELEAADLLVP
jgi:hypothetical protein